MKTLESSKQLEKESELGNLWHVVLIDYRKKSFSHLESFDSYEDASLEIGRLNSFLSLQPGCVYDIFKTDENGVVESDE